VAGRDAAVLNRRHGHANGKAPTGRFFLGNAQLRIERNVVTKVTSEFFTKPHKLTHKTQINRLIYLSIFMLARMMLVSKRSPS
jgi:hypothetical protein